MWWNEMELFEFLQFITGTSDLRRSVSPPPTRKIRRVDGRVKHIFLGEKYSRQWKMVRTRHRDPFAACACAAGSHSDWLNQIRLARAPGANVLGDVVAK